MIMDEISRRRSGEFREGRRVLLADGGTWAFPTAGQAWGLDSPEYQSLVRAVVEADEEFDRRLAELAMAIFLLGSNYELSPEDFQRLLTFEPGSPEQSAWGLALRGVIAEHVREAWFLDAQEVAAEPDGQNPRRGHFGVVPRWLDRWRSLAFSRR
ncbi:hypothetical protein [Planctomyces sp. SH-PL62]|uniref:hypothetical protein n=1 Tax=Planctomyces sp. SH-PL62 TaxID=1636152 RepID=UPI0012E6F35D|nr:hypothetical protein [Planctomyces sp. SH-PL62]